jgi:hypothetical protein
MRRPSVAREFVALELAVLESEVEHSILLAKARCVSAR